MMVLLKRTGIALGVLVALWIGWGTYMTVSTPEPPYEVVQNLADDIEVRKYEAQTWISAPAGGDNASFRILASYIFGDNERDQKIAMTAPVVSDERMSFILPEDLSEETAPSPNGQPIEFTGVPERSVATLQFSWWTNSERVKDKAQTLLETLARNGIETIGEPFLMRYNDPWTPPFMRRNEVGIVVESGTNASGA
jgi:hypothetical protein